MTAHSIRLPILVCLLTVEACVHSFNIPIYDPRYLDPHTIEHQERRLAAAHSMLCPSYQDHHWSLCPVYSSNSAVNSVSYPGDPNDEARILHQQLLLQTYKLQDNVRSGFNFNYNPNLVQQPLNRAPPMTNNFQNSWDYSLLQRYQNPLENIMNKNINGFLGQALPTYNYNSLDSSYDEFQYPLEDVKRELPRKQKMAQFIPKLRNRYYSDMKTMTTRTHRKTRETVTTSAPIMNFVTRPMIVHSIANINMIRRKHDPRGKRLLNTVIMKYTATTIPINLLRARLKTAIPKNSVKIDNISRHLGNVLNALKPSKTEEDGTTPVCVVTEKNVVGSMNTLEYSITSTPEIASFGTESFLTVPSTTSLPATEAVTISSTTEMPQSVPKSLQENESNRTTVSLPILYKEPSRDVLEKNLQNLDHFDRKFYTTTFTKLSSISPADRRENGISFVESGLFLYLILTALSMEVDPKTREEIEDILALPASDTEKLDIINWTVNMLPKTSDTLKFRWSSRLVVNETFHLATKAAETLRLHLDNFNSTEPSDKLMQYLNHLVEIDSGGAMRDTFEEDEVSDGVRAALLSTVYVRARWRASPTLLNGTRPFRDVEGAPARTARMIRINDIVQYADLTEWDAEAVEIPYSTPGLSLLVLVPRGPSLRALAGYMSTAGLRPVFNKMRSMRVATTLPIYTLRMTLLLPNKLQAMGISRLLDINNSTAPTDLRLSHAVQRLMFWAEAGRNAFKDDGIEWDNPPQMELLVDRPYLFFVRWHNVTIMNGNFVL